MFAYRVNDIVGIDGVHNDMNMEYGVAGLCMSVRDNLYAVNERGVFEVERIAP